MLTLVPFVQCSGSYQCHRLSLLSRPLWAAPQMCCARPGGRHLQRAFTGRAQAGEKADRPL